MTENGRVTSLVLVDEQLTGTVPAALDNLDKLEHLDLSSNQLTGTVPSTLGTLDRLKYLDLSSNQLTGSIPPELDNLSNLFLFGIHDNDIVGCISPYLSVRIFGGLYQSNGLVGGTELARCDCGFEFLLSIKDTLRGTADLNWDGATAIHAWDGVGAWYGQDVSGCVTGLNLAGRSLDGILPDRWEGLPLLRELWLEENALTGEIPETLGNLPDLTLVALSHNDFVGCVPETVSRLLFEPVYSNATGDFLPECGPPSFASTVPAQTYVENTSIPRLILPQVTGGNAPLSYRLTPVVPGLTFDAALRQLSGTPTSIGTYAMTYSVSDADGATDSLNFTITVNPLVTNPVAPSDITGRMLTFTSTRPKSGSCGEPLNSTTSLWFSQ